jgi:hypothetical protein
VRARHGPQRSRRASAPRARRHGPAPRRVVADPRRAEDFARWQRERAEARAHNRHAASELAAAIDVGDAGYRRLRRRLDDFGTRLEVVRAAQCARER